jgi:hypothetical protein
MGRRQVLARDLHVWTESAPLSATGSGTQYGTLFVEYEVRPYTNVRNLGAARAYVISCKQRIVIPSACQSGTTSFTGYPAFLTNSMTLLPQSEDDSFALIDYAPKTLNSSIATTQSTSGGQESSASLQYTTGSSLAQTNSYDVSVNLGLNADALTGGASRSQSHSDTYTVDQSLSTGAVHGQETQMGASDAITIKDWASYGSVDKANQVPSWTWAQEYPWDVLEFQTSVGSYVLLPDYVKQRLCQGTPPVVFPPSKLALFGLSFVSRASWLYTMADTAQPADVVSFRHAVSYATATHGIFDTKIQGEIDQVLPSWALPAAGATATQLDLGRLALDPIPSDPNAGGAIVGFVLSQFVVAPSPTAHFSVKSAANNLLVTGTGFDTPASDDAAMQASAVSTTTPAVMRVEFKIADVDEIYVLFIKHWKTTPAGCVMTLTINAGRQGSATVIRHVDAEEAGSGTDNMAKIVLRNRDYTTGEFYDYLQMGLNTVDITVTPAAPATSAGYAVRALAVA